MSDNPYIAPRQPHIPVTVPLPTFCTRCQIHAATTLRPLCPVCLDIEAKEGKR